MIILLHVLCALSSLVATTWAAFAPSKTKLRVGYSLTAMTLASGTYLVISLHAPLLSSCETGLIYLSLAMAGLLRARRAVL
ncbi:MAG TPA: hypothetical protein VHB51_00335 [Candidatus Saccharimonadales bacterium]|nr:hypothetical protein [Candidatus Saccharimonadales bacterium]